MLRAALPLALSLAAMLPLPATAEFFLRWNQAGYAPARPKSLVAMSDADLAGRRWTILRADFVGLAEPVRRGEFGASVVGAGDRTPLSFNHTAAFTSLTEPGLHGFVVASAPPRPLPRTGTPRPFSLRPFRP